MKGGGGMTKMACRGKICFVNKSDFGYFIGSLLRQKSGAADITPQHRTFANMNMIMTRMVLQSLFDFRDTWLALQPLQLWLTSDISYPWSSYYLE